MQKTDQISAEQMAYYRERAHAERAMAIRDFFWRISAAIRRRKIQAQTAEFCAQEFAHSQAG